MEKTIDNNWNYKNNVNYLMHNCHESNFIMQKKKKKLQKTFIFFIQNISSFYFWSGIWSGHVLWDSSSLLCFLFYYSQCLLFYEPCYSLKAFWSDGTTNVVTGLLWCKWTSTLSSLYSISWLLLLMGCESVSVLIFSPFSFHA